MGGRIVVNYIEGSDGGRAKLLRTVRLAVSDPAGADGGRVSGEPLRRGGERRRHGRDGGVDDAAGRHPAMGGRVSRGERWSVSVELVDSGAAAGAGCGGGGKGP